MENLALAGVLSLIFGLLFLGWAYYLSDRLGMGMPPWTLNELLILAATISVIIVVTYLVWVRWPNWWKQRH